MLGTVILCDVQRGTPDAVAQMSVGLAGLSIKGYM